MRLANKSNHRVNEDEIAKTWRMNMTHIHLCTNGKR